MSDSLVDLLDRIVDTGVAATGDVTISLAEVELITLRLQLLLDSIGTEDAPPLSFPSRKRARPTRTVKLEGDEQSLQRGLSQLVLVVVELLGELLERQALRRMAAGTLRDDEVRKLGDAFAALHKRLDELHEELLDASHEKRRPLSEPPLRAVR
jgi:ubiquinone biosynthesis protein UbiJ